MTPSSSRLPGSKLRVVLLGYGHLGLSLLEGLLASPYCEVIGVFRWSTRIKDARYWEPEEKAFGRLIARSRIPELVFPGANSFEFTRYLAQAKPDVVLIGYQTPRVFAPHVPILQPRDLAECCARQGWSCRRICSNVRVYRHRPC